MDRFRQRGRVRGELVPVMAAAPSPARCSRLDAWVFGAGYLIGLVAFAAVAVLVGGG